MLEVVTSYTWPNDRYPFMGLRMRVDELASRLGVATHAWHEDGLGPACGFGFRAATGRVYMLQELEVTFQFHGAPGPAVFVDAADLARCGAEMLVDEVFAALELDRSHVAFITDDSARKNAAELVAKIEVARSGLGSLWPAKGTKNVS